MVSEKPLYARVAVALSDQIERGKIAPFGQLPSEKHLIESYGVSRATIRNAIRELRGEGKVVSKNGKGHFVAAHRTIVPVHGLEGLGEALAPYGKHTHARVISFKSIETPNHVRDQLDIGSSTRVWELIRLRYCDAEPLSLDHSYLLDSIGNQFTSIEAEGDIFPLVERKQVLLLGQADVQITATPAPPDARKLLDMGLAHPVLRLLRLVRDENGRKIIFEHIDFRSDRYAMTLQLDR